MRYYTFLPFDSITMTSNFVLQIQITWVLLVSAMFFSLLAATYLFFGITKGKKNVIFTVQFIFITLIFGGWFFIPYILDYFSIK